MRYERSFCVQNHGYFDAWAFTFNKYNGSKLRTLHVYNLDLLSIIYH